MSVPPQPQAPMPAHPSSTTYYSAHVGIVTGPKGEFDHFSRQLDDSHRMNGFYRFSTVADERYAYARGYLNPEDVLRAVEIGETSLEDINLRWFPGLVDTNMKLPRAGSPAQHIKSIYEARQYLGKPVSSRTHVPLYPVDPRLKHFWEAERASRSPAIVTTADPAAVVESTTGVLALLNSPLQPASSSYQQARATSRAPQVRDVQDYAAVSYKNSKVTAPRQAGIYENRPPPGHITATSQATRARVVSDGEIYRGRITDKGTAEHERSRPAVQAVRAERPRELPDLPLLQRQGVVPQLLETQRLGHSQSQLFPPSVNRAALLPSNYSKALPPPPSSSSRTTKIDVTALHSSLPSTRQTTYISPYAPRNTQAQQTCGNVALLPPITQAQPQLAPAPLRRLSAQTPADGSENFSGHTGIPEVTPYSSRRTELPQTAPGGQNRIETSTPSTTLRAPNTFNGARLNAPGTNVPVRPPRDNTSAVRPHQRSAIPAQAVAVQQITLGENAAILREDDDIPDMATMSIGSRSEPVVKSAALPMFPCICCEQDEGHAWDCGIGSKHATPMRTSSSANTS
jgi:hypothetical protein